jgi:beta-phosphoglucomutase family hydrolase
VEFSAIIFDCDGTLADTMPAHYEAWIDTLARYELVMSEDRFYALGGWPTERVAELLIRESGRAVDAAQVAREKEARFEELLHRIRPIGPVVDAVMQYQGKLPLAVATGATRAICERILRQIGVWGMFQAIVSCEDVRRHKPAPDIFLEAARRLEVAPAGCLVYEDTDPGIEAARAAGMDTVDVRSFHTPRRVT